MKSVMQSTVENEWVPCHHDMARSQVADGGETADKGWSCSLLAGLGVTIPNHKKQHVTKCYTDETAGSIICGGRFD
jgi:hypothetical protein